MDTIDYLGFDAVGQHADAPAESLLFTEFRCLMAGYSTRDITCWDIAWSALEAGFALKTAKALYGEFHCFIRMLRDNAKREIGWRPAPCRCLCRDECLVLALVEASQRGAVPEEEAHAANLLGHDDTDALVAASRSLGRAIAREGLRLKTPIRVAGRCHAAETRKPSVH